MQSRGKVGQQDALAMLGSGSMDTFRDLEGKLQKLKLEIAEGIGGGISERRKILEMKRIIGALGNLDDERTLEPLVSLLDDDDFNYEYYDVFYSAINALAVLGNEQAVDPLVGLLEVDEGRDRNWLDTEVIIDALGAIGNERAVEPLVDMLDDDDEYDSESIIDALGAIGNERAVEPLVGLLDGGKDYEIERAIKALGSIGDVRAVEPLVGLLDDDDYIEDVIDALGAIGNERAVDTLVGLLDGGKDYEIERAIKALGSIGDVRAVEPLVGLLDGAEDRVIERLIKALGSIGGERAVEELENQSGRNVPWNLSIIALESLAFLGNNKAFEDLISILDERGSRKVKDVADILGRLGDQRAVEPLISIIPQDDRGYNYVRYAVDALGKLGGERSIEALIAVLHDETVTWMVRDDVVQILEDRGDEHAVDALIEVLEHSESQVVIPAIRALGKLGFERAIEPLRNADYENLGRWQGHHAEMETSISLGKLGDEGVFDSLLEMVEKHWEPHGKNALDILIGLDRERAFEPLWEIYLTNRGGEEILGKLDEINEEAFESLVMKFYDYSDLGEYSDKGKARVALYAIKQLNHERANKVMFHVLEEHDLANLGNSATRHLREFGGKDAFEPVLNSLERDWGGETPTEVFRFLSESEDERAVGPLLRFQNKNEWDILGVIALGKIGDPRAVDDLIRLVETPVRYRILFEVIKALGKIGHEKAVYPLDNLMHERDEQGLQAICYISLHSIGGSCEIGYGRKWSILSGLSDIGDQKSVDFLADGAAENVESRGLPKRIDCIRTLIGMKSELIIGPLIRVFENRYPGERGMALEAIVDFGESAITPLVEALPESGWKTKVCVAKALGRIGGKEQIKILKDLEKDEDSDVKEAASNSIKYISERDE